MSNILFTMAEDLTLSTDSKFGLKYHVDEHDCLHFAQSLHNLGHQVYFVNWLDLVDGEFTRMFCFNEQTFVEPVLIDDFDLAFIYKMEGFYFDRPRFEAMLRRLRGLLTVNNTATILHNMNKQYLWQLQEAGIAIIPSYKVEDVIERLGQEKFVIKPLFGERGSGIFIAANREDLSSIAGSESEYLAQKFMPEIRDGERSLVFLGKEYQHAVIKHPAPANKDEFRCNESLGGTVAIYEPDDAEIQFCLSVLEAYERLGFCVHFSRIDILSTSNGPVLLEAELLNPSIYANYSGKGQSFGVNIAQYFDALILQARCKQKDNGELCPN